MINVTFAIEVQQGERFENMRLCTGVNAVPRVGEHVYVHEIPIPLEVDCVTHDMVRGKIIVNLEDYAVPTRYPIGQLVLDMVAKGWEENI